MLQQNYRILRIDMATPPIRPHPLKRQENFEAALVLRDWVIRAIGIDSLPAFELWAFKSCPYGLGQMVYDEHVVTHWQNAHSTKGMTGATTECVRDMVRIWKERFQSVEDSSSEEDIFPIQLERDAEVKEKKEWPSDRSFGD
jgi:hypothetical protein